MTTWTKGDVDAVRASAESVLRAVQLLAVALLEDDDEAAAEAKDTEEDSAAA